MITVVMRPVEHLREIVVVCAVEFFRERTNTLLRADKVRTVILTISARAIHASAQRQLKSIRQDSRSVNRTVKCNSLVVDLIGICTPYHVIGLAVEAVDTIYTFSVLINYVTVFVMRVNRTDRSIEHRHERIDDCIEARCTYVCCRTRRIGS